MLAAGHKMGQAQAQQQMQAQAQQQAAVEQAKQQGAAQAQAAAPAIRYHCRAAETGRSPQTGVLTDEEFAAMKKKLLGL